MNKYIFNADGKCVLKLDAAYIAANPAESISSTEDYFTNSGGSVIDSATDYDKDEIVTSDGINIIEKMSLNLTADCTDSYSPYDGVPDIPADGVADTTITIQKKDAQGNDMTDAGDNDVVTITATRGILSALSVTLSNGTATFDLKSCTETVVSEVTCESDKDNVDGGSIDIQFHPV